MTPTSPQRVLLIGDGQRDVQTALMQAVPGAQVTSVPTLFDGIAALSDQRFTAVLAAAEPLERRPQAAVRTLREMAGEARLLLFGDPTLEILSRKMQEFGADDYVITPPNPAELENLFGAPPLRLTPATTPDDQTVPATDDPAQVLARLPLADIVLDAMLGAPHGAVGAALTEINRRVGPEMTFSFTKPNQAAPTAGEGASLFSTAIHTEEAEAGTIHLLAPASEDPSGALEALAHLSPLIGKMAELQERHNRLQRLAITDELTGLYNARYFRHFLSLILQRARKMHFPVTLLLFDIDDFKKYNDQFGHAIGDDILRQAAALMRRCSRQHDLVARIGGDEFAVIFWDKDGPRQPRSPKPGAVYRPPQEPLQIFERFKTLISSEDFPLLGESGKGSLTVSAGLAVFPWDAGEAEALVEEADRRLMMGAKKHGKNSIHIVGADDLSM